MIEQPPGWSHDLLEAVISSSTLDHHTPICRGPHDGPHDLGLAREGTETIPHWRLQRVAKLIATAPPLNIHKVMALEPMEHDPVDATTPAGAAAEWNRRCRHLQWPRCRRLHPEPRPSWRPAPRAPARSTRPTQARAVRAVAAPDACARPRVRTASNTALPDQPCTSGTAALANRARRAAVSPLVSSAATTSGTARQA